MVSHQGSLLVWLTYMKKGIRKKVILTEGCSVIRVVFYQGFHWSVPCECSCLLCGCSSLFYFGLKWKILGDFFFFFWIRKYTHHKWVQKKYGMWLLKIWANPGVGHQSVLVCISLILYCNVERLPAHFWNSSSSPTCSLVFTLWFSSPSFRKQLLQ